MVDTADTVDITVEITIDTIIDIPLIATIATTTAAHSLCGVVRAAQYVVRVDEELLLPPRHAPQGGHQGRAVSTTSAMDGISAGETEREGQKQR